MFIKATSYDQFLAVAYFQEGVSNFLLGKFDHASENFNDALMVAPSEKFPLINSTFEETSALTMNNSALSLDYTRAKPCSIED